MPKKSIPSTEIAQGMGRQGRCVLHVAVAGRVWLEVGGHRRNKRQSMEES